MRIIPPFRSPRIGVTLREMTLGDGIELCARPDIMHEANQGRALVAMIETHEGRPGQESDVRLWTVHERKAVIAHYMAGTFQEGDFPVGETGRYSHYLYHDQMTAQAIEVGMIDDEAWSLVPLLGFHAEAIERLIVARRLPAGRLGWMLGAMAFQLRRSEDLEREFCASIQLPAPPLHELPEALLDDWLAHRVDVLRKLPDSVIAQLTDSHLIGFEAQQHLLQLAIHPEGLVLVSEVPGSPPARFPVPQLFSVSTARLLEGLAEPA